MVLTYMCARIHVVYVRVRPRSYCNCLSALFTVVLSKFFFFFLSLLLLVRSHPLITHVCSAIITCYFQTSAKSFLRVCFGLFLQQVQGDTSTSTTIANVNGGPGRDQHFLLFVSEPTQLLLTTCGGSWGGAGTSNGGTTAINASVIFANHILS